VLLKSSNALHWVSVDRGKTWKPSTLDDVRRNDVHWSGRYSFLTGLYCPAGPFVPVAASK